WIGLGSVVADTFFLKADKPWNRLTFASGLPLFFRRYPPETVFSFALAPCGLLVLAAPERRVVRLMLLLLAYAVVYYAGYAFLRAGAYHWSCAPLATVAVMLGALGVASLQRRSAAAWPERAVFAGVSLLATVGLGTFLARAGTLAPPEAPIHTNWATPAQYRA